MGAAPASLLDRAGVAGPTAVSPGGSGPSLTGRHSGGGNLAGLERLWACKESDTTG